MKVSQTPYYPTPYPVDLLASVDQVLAWASDKPGLAVPEAPSRPTNQRLLARPDGLAGGFDSLLAQSFRPSQKPPVRPGVDESIFRYKRNDGFDRPNTAERYNQPVDRGVGSPSQIARLRIEYGKALATAGGAWVRGYWLAGELLRNYLSGTGTPVEVSGARVGAVNPQGYNGNRNIIESHYAPTSELRRQLDQRVKSYFAQHPQAKTVTATSDWLSCYTDVNSDGFYALNALYSSLRGVFVKDSYGNINGRIQAVGLDYYDFSPIGLDLPTPFGPVLQKDLHHMGNPEVGLAKGFDVWVAWPVLQVRLSK